ncbi:MAG: prephenate dehydratase domain-containing protein, partial [Bacilli bacterium]
MSIIRYLGEEGSYSHLTALNYQKKHNLKTASLKSFKSISKIISTPSYEDTLMIIPIENSLSGDVYESYQQILEYGIDIIDTYVLNIEHVLIALQGSRFNDIKEVYSHPQALLQVTSYLDKHHLIGVPDFSTAHAIKKVATLNNHKIAAIGSKEALKAFTNLVILDEKISNHHNNQTRFLIAKPLNQKLVYQVSLNNLNQQAHLFFLFTLGVDQAGQLSDVLNLISQYHIN